MRDTQQPMLHRSRMLQGYSACIIDAMSRRQQQQQQQHLARGG